MSVIFVRFLASEDPRCDTALSIQAERLCVFFGHML